MLNRFLCWLLGHDWLHSPYQSPNCAFDGMVNLSCSRCGRQHTVYRTTEEPHVCPDYSKEIEHYKSLYDAEHEECTKAYNDRDELRRQIADVKRENQ